MSRNIIINNLRYFIVLIIIITSSQVTFCQHTYDSETTYIYKFKNKRIITSADRVEGTSYRIDVIKTPFFDSKDPALKELKKWGKVDKEFWMEDSEYHILVGSFFDKSKATKTLTAIKRQGFPDAKIVRLNDGIRE